MTTKRFVTFGETMVQYNAAFVGPFDEGGEYMLDCAGAESNVAVDLQKLGIPDIETVWISNVGDDAAGSFILDELKDRTTTVATIINGVHTGVSYLNHHADDQHVKTYRRKGSAASMLTPQNVEPHLLGADVLHVTGITPALSDDCRETVFSALEVATNNGIPVSFDLNFREQLWDIDDARETFEGMLKYASLFKVGHDEAEMVWGKGLTPEGYAEYFHGIGNCLVVVTLADEGAIAFDGSNWIGHSGFKVDVTDPVGAGDAFVAGLLGGILEHHTLKGFLALPVAELIEALERSLEIANACGALTCTRRGDTAAMPTMVEARKFALNYAKAPTT